MKKWLFIIGLTFGPAFAAPSCYIEPVPVGVAQCGALIDAAPKVIVPVVVIAGIRSCEVDVGTVTSASHTCRFTLISTAASGGFDPVWGDQESAPSTVPFSFLKPAPPAPPVVSGLRR